jgi:hypothetical protein
MYENATKEKSTENFKIPVGRHSKLFKLPSQFLHQRTKMLIANEFFFMNFMLKNNANSLDSVVLNQIKFMVTSEKQIKEMFIRSNLLIEMLIISTPVFTFSHF